MPKPLSLLPSRTALTSIARGAQNSSVGGGKSVVQRCQRLSTSTSTSTVRRTSLCARRGFLDERIGASVIGSAKGKLGGYGVRGYKTVQEQRSRYRSGPFSTRAGLLFLSAGASLIFYFRYEKARMERKRVAEAAKGVGRPKVGGPFTLLDQHGNTYSDERMKGRYSLVYFGFSHCPDICPEELDKMAQMIDLINASPLLQSKDSGALPPLLPLFITCDPARDTPAVLSEYLSEFHPSIIGLTGTWEQIKDVCKKYRVYFSTPEGVKKGEDYLVDHSIYFYLMDPEGDFVEAIGRQHSPQDAAAIVLGHVGDWVASKR